MKRSKISKIINTKKLVLTLDYEMIQKEIYLKALLSLLWEYLGSFYV
jgi:hypothetical protein